MRWSHADITDNFAIKRYTSINYKSLSHLIAYGADHAQHVSISKESRAQYPFLLDTYAFKVARIEPENNIEMILKAFKGSRHKLVIVGNWEASDYGKRLKATYSQEINIFILDPIYEQRQLDELRSNCFIYIHGHSAGGTNPSLVEAMFLGLPIFAYDCPYNRATMENAGVYFKSSESLNQVIENLPVSELIAHKTKMKEIADRRYTWKEIANGYSNLIKSFGYNYKKRKVNSNWSKVPKSTLINNELAHLKRPMQYFED